MSTDFQRSRTSLGARLRELRTEGGLTGRELAARLGWGQSKVSKLENGRQTPSSDDLSAWARETGNPEAEAELLGRLRGLETWYRSWRRQLAGGFRVVQEAHDMEARKDRLWYSFDSEVVPGLFQTPDYAGAVLSRHMALHTAPRDLAAAVRARMARQDVLRDRSRTFHFLIWEAALYARPCAPAVLAEQLDLLVGRLASAEHVRVGIVPFSAEMRIPAGAGFVIHDDRLVIIETWHAELWLDGSEDVALHRRVWDALNATAVYGAEAHRLVHRARCALGS
ncbi:helix-turn-helix domain-containing protein [Nocardiopsis potens]|uniref:helix-turn-helix domain-containing protein n=1 Tax=Nocardiopsis potens TaxID=1246458 RepID=UPI000346104D|nr:helix-turn-helix transcriptional regulator [Nocardiopsis potens]